jgi:hypothetical protein
MKTSEFACRKRLVYAANAGHLCRSTEIDLKELKDYIVGETDLAAAEWTDADYQELFDYLDFRKRGKVSLEDFAQATIAPLQREQLKQACNASKMVDLLLDVIPLQVGWDPEGHLYHPLGKVADMTVDDMTALFSKHASTVSFALLPSSGPLLAV